MLGEQLRSVPQDQIDPLVEKIADLSKISSLLGQFGSVYLGTYNFEIDLRFKQLAQQPETRLTIEKVVDIIGRNHQWTTGDWQRIIPLTPILHAIKSPEVGATYLLGALERREQLEQRMRARYGDRRAFVHLGNFRPVEMILSDSIEIGMNRIIFADSGTYRNDYSDNIKVPFGHIDFDYRNPALLIVNEVQDECILVDAKGDYVRSESGVILVGSTQRKYDTVSSTGQRNIRHFMKQGRDVVADTYETEKPGVEELMVYATLGILVQSGVLSPTAQVLIPKAEITAWGGVDTNFNDGGHGTEVARNNTLAAAIAKLSPTMQERLKQVYNWGTSYDYERENEHFKLADALCGFFAYREYHDGYAYTPRILVEGPQEYRVGLGKYLADLMLSEIPNEFKPRFRYPSGSFTEFMLRVAQCSAAYKRTFHVYRTAFGEVEAEHTRNGRRIARKDLQRLPFANRMIIDPIAA